VLLLFLGQLLEPEALNKQCARTCIVAHAVVLHLPAAAEQEKQESKYSSTQTISQRDTRTSMCGQMLAE